ncbi:hypothetical protein DL762_004612 [Monosporascus cannonballus]|uniref:RING-14 protein n=1 Tax=Monosporascus cannonballus TaxID=155416 RepID=A0ABY0H763_9PEZI|nr:hypothetical protein DL762_004612 [Monosporascus cannonballus]
MKFAQEFRKSLQREGFPQRWVESAIPYGQLKKCIKKVTKELNELGLDRDVLAQLASSQKDSSDSSSSPSGDLGFRYNLDEDTTDSRHLRPRLTVFVHLSEGVAVDAYLTPATRRFLEKIASKAPADRDSLPDSGHAGTGSPPTTANSYVPAESLPSPDQGSAAEPARPSSVQRVEVPLVFDGEFFNILQTDVSNLDTLQEEEQKKLQGEVRSLGREVTKITAPSKGRKSRRDLEKWREIFELYLDARVFFSTRETDHGARTGGQALEQLKWFQDQVLQRNILQGFRLEASRQAFKFDKRTSLGAAKTFPIVVHSDRLLAGSVAKDICAQMSSELVSVVPQLDDYLCPVCFTVAYWPLRLDCQHVFCSRCLVKMARKGERYCPLCRADVVMEAGLDHFDSDRAAFLRKYFPHEVKEKVRANELERNREIFGPDYVEKPCSVM